MYMFLTILNTPLPQNYHTNRSRDRRQPIMSKNVFLQPITSKNVFSRRTNHKDVHVSWVACGGSFPDVHHIPTSSCTTATSVVLRGLFESPCSSESRDRGVESTRRRVSSTRDTFVAQQPSSKPIFLQKSMLRYHGLEVLLIVASLSNVTKLTLCLH